MRSVIVLAAAALLGSLLVVIWSRSDPEGRSTAEPVTAGTESPLPHLQGRGRPPASLVQGFTITGRVVDTTGRAVPGVRVAARRSGSLEVREDDGEGPGPSREARFRSAIANLDSTETRPATRGVTGLTDERGSFALRVPRSGWYGVSGLPEPGRVATGMWLTVGARRVEGPVELRIRDASALRVRAIDPAGRGLRVLVHGEWEPEGTKAEWTLEPVWTDSGTGEASLLVPAGKGSLNIRHPGVADYADVKVTTPRESFLVARLGGSQGVIAGHVRDTNGAGLADVDLLIEVRTSVAGRGESGPTTYTLRGHTGSDGAYRLDAPLAGDLTSVQALREGYVLHSSKPPLASWSGARVASGRETRVDAVLAGGGSVTGRVLAERTKRGLDGARVTLAAHFADESERLDPLVVSADEQGRFRFEGVPLGKWLLVPERAGYFVAAFEADPSDRSFRTARVPPAGLTLVLSRPGEVVERDVEMSGGSSVAGRVLLPDGSPAPGAAIWASSGGPGDLAEKWDVGLSLVDLRLGTSREDGTFEICGLAPREAWSLYPTLPGFLGRPSESFRVVSGESVSGIDLRLEAGASVAGRVVDAEGRPVCGAYVAHEGEWERGSLTRTTSTGPDGTFLLTQVPDGRVRIVAWTREYTSERVGIHPELEPNETRAGVVVPLRNGLPVDGVLVDEAGEPVARRQVIATWRYPNGETSQSRNTDVDGRFHFDAPAGHDVELEVLAEGPGYAPLTTVTPPASNLRFTVRRLPTWTIVGRVVDPAGVAVPLCTVHLGSWNSNEVVNGEFRLVTGSPPPYEITAARARDARDIPLNLCRKTVQVVSLGDAPVVITLEAGERLSGRVVDEEGTGVAGVWVEWGRQPGGSEWIRTDEGGDFAIQGLEHDSPIDLCFEPPPGYVVPSPVSRRPDGGLLQVRVDRFTEIRGRVVSSDGRPLKDAVVRAWRSERDEVDSARTDPTGAFHLRHIPPGATVELIAWPWDDDEPTHARATLQGVKAGSGGVALVCERGAPIQGTFATSSGETIEPLTVVVRRRSGGQAEEERKVVRPGRGSFCTRTMGSGPCTVSVESAAGEVLVEPFPVSVPADPLRVVVPDAIGLKGQIQGAAPLGRFRVFAFRGTDPTKARSSTTTDADGSFTLTVTRGIAYRFGARSARDDRFSLVGPVDPAGTPLRLALSEGRSISGRAESREGPVACLRVVAMSEQWTVETTTDRLGDFVLHALPPGTYRVTAELGDGQGTLVVDGVAAGTTGLELRPR